MKTKTQKDSEKKLDYEYPGNPTGKKRKHTKKLKSFGRLPSKEEDFLSKYMIM